MDNNVQDVESTTVKEAESQNMNEVKESVGVQVGSEQSPETNDLEVAKEIIASEKKQRIAKFLTEFQGLLKDYNIGTRIKNSLVDNYIDSGLEFVALD